MKTYIEDQWNCIQRLFWTHIAVCHSALVWCSWISFLLGVLSDELSTTLQKTQCLNCNMLHKLV